MGNSGSFDTGTGEIASRTGEFLAGVLALSRISRVTVALESGHGAGPALLAAARLTGHAETCLLFDQWRGDPLADLTAALLDGYPDLLPASGETLAQSVRKRQSRDRHSFLVILDRFDAFLARPADQPLIAAFGQAFVQMANDSELDVHFLLVLDEAAEPLLDRFQEAIPGIGDGCLRMPSGATGEGHDEAPAADTGRASRRDRSFGMLLERLTAITPADEAATDQPRAPEPSMTTMPAMTNKPPAVVVPAEHIRPPADDTTAQAIRPDDTMPVSAPAAPTSASETVPEPVPARRAPSFAAAPAAEITAPADAAAPAPASSLPVEPSPASEAAADATRPRRSKALPAIVAIMLAFGAGLYAYRQQVPATPKTPPAAAVVAPTTPDPVVADKPVDAAKASPAATSGPALMSAPTIAAAAPPAVPSPPPTQAATAATAAAAPAAARAAPTVYVHVRSQRERDRVQALTRTLAGHGIRVVDVKVMSKGPSVADVRYFRDEDRAAAQTVQQALAAAGVPVPRLSRMKGFENSTRPGHFEAWLGDDKSPEPAGRR